MKVQGKEIRSVQYLQERNVIKLIDQRFLPECLKFFEVKNYEEASFAIKNMVVRGAPAIGVTAAFGVAQAKIQNEDMKKVVKSLRETRPTAHDLNFAIDEMMKKNDCDDPVERAIEYSDKTVDKAKKIGEYGEKLIKENSTILTHCNAGALATVDYGTALAPIRLAREKGKT
jgi:translation initiation factor 2B subunit I family (IF-2BI)